LDKTIITAFLIIAGVVTAVAVFNTIYPAIIEGSQAITSMEERIDDRLKSQIEIVHAAPEGQVNPDRAFVWVKNVGSAAIRAVEGCDVFFGPEGDFARIPHGTGNSHWEYTVENDTDWNPTATLKITIDLDYDLSDGERYFIKVVTPNGIADEYYFSK
jgi:archaellum component FlaG (FlaF/FlaG flagellin family)